MFPGPFPNNNWVLPLIAEASNVHTTTNPAYTTDDFLMFYPQFDGNIDTAILDQFVAMASAAVEQSRWHEGWPFGMNLFIAHFATLYLQTLGPPNPTANQVIGAAQARGLVTSKSVGDVSVGQDFSAISNDLAGWANWALTNYGQTFATLARTLGLAGVYVY